MTTVESIIKELQARRGKWRELAAQTGLGYWWLLKFARGAIAEPGLSKIQALQAYFATHPIHDAESLGEESHPEVAPSKVA